MPPAAAARIGLDVLDALTAAHRAGVLHRDVKPHNVLIGHDGRVVLTDFGLATFVDDGSVTGPGLVVGSPQYVSPERARDGASTRGVRPVVVRRDPVRGRRGALAVSPGTARWPR